MQPDICTCPGCICELDDTAIRKGDQYFCCEGCAQGHAGQRGCREPECPCADKARRSPPSEENKLDHSLEETFPASDPISP